MGFGNGAFQAAKIAIDGVTVIENIFTGKIQTGPNVGVGIAAINESTLAIPIINSQNIDTPVPFQQMIQLNLSQYPQLQGIASDLSNIYFSSDQKGQNKLYSWRETPASLTSDVIWWVLLPNGIPANGTVIIYLQVSSSTALDGVYTGEAPQLSPNYGEYDNGANVFTNYWNFAGTSLPSGFVSANWVGQTNTGTVTVNNGLTYSAGSSYEQVIYYSASTFSAPIVFETYAEGTASNGLRSSASSGISSLDNSFNGNVWVVIDKGGGGWGYWYGDTYTSVAYPTLSLNTFYVFGVSSSGSGGSLYAYGSGQSPINPFVSTTQSAPFPSSFYLVPVYVDNGATQITYWTRVRAYPPNGIMPALQATAVKVVQSVITSTSNTWTAPQTYTAPQNINVGQTKLTGTTAGSIVYSMPYQGSSYKKFIAYASGYENDTTTAQTISFPVAFTNTPYVVTSPSGLISSISTTGITLASGTTTTYTGWVIIEGY